MLRSRSFVVGVLVSLAVLLLAMSHLPTPFGGDQALFVEGARSIERGEVLYRDFWDNKAPGILLFYWLGGKLFGFSEPGIHMMEIVWNLILGTVLVLALRANGLRRELLILVPVLAIGAYYTMAGFVQLTQVEALIALPMLTSLLLANATLRRDSLARQFLFWALAAACASVVAIFKVILAPIAIPIWLTVLVVRGIERRLGWREIVVFLSGCLVGGMIPLLAVGGWFAAHDTLREMLWTIFKYPTLSLDQVPHATLMRLIKSTAWLVLPFCFLLPALGFAARGWRGAGRELLYIQFAVWIAAAAAMVLVQRFSWWSYHFAQFMVPLSGLLLRGLHGVWQVMEGRFGAARAKKEMPWAAFAGCMPILLLATEPMTYMTNGFKAGAFASPAFVRELSDDYKDLYRESQCIVREGVGRPTLYVIGNPIIYHLTGLSQDIRVNGWAVDYFLDSHWAEIADAIQSVRPKYLYISFPEGEYIPQRNSVVGDVINGIYEIKLRGQAGMWYQLKEGFELAAKEEYYQFEYD